MMARAEIITIGDEILIGQTVDTNSAWIGAEMWKLGLPVDRITSISDKPDEIVKALESGLLSSQVVLLTGGLGPTSDDRTKSTLAGFFGSHLTEDPDVLKDIEVLLRSRNVPISSLNRAQALVPDNCLVIRNRCGTAPGMWFERGDRVVISMPGVPYEMISMMEESVLPMLRNRFPGGNIGHKTLMTCGIPESRLASMLADWENRLPPGYSVAYLPSPGLVKLRITGRSDDARELEAKLADLSETLSVVVGDSLFAREETSIEEVCGRLLAGNGQTISTAESCTGGNIARLITRIPGSSDYFTGSVVAYSNRVKIAELGVDPEAIDRYGAVSREVVRQMAEGCRIKFGTDYSVAVSGIAGPGGGTEEKPVGTTWIAVSSSSGVTSEMFLLGEHRERNITKASITALNLLRLRILKDPQK